MGSAPYIYSYVYLRLDPAGMGQNENACRDSVAAGTRSFWNGPDGLSLREPARNGDQNLAVPDSAPKKLTASAGGGRLLFQSQHQFWTKRGMKTFTI